MPALERYDGPMFTMLRKRLPDYPDTLCLIVSAKYGTIHSGHPIRDYDLRMVENGVFPSPELEESCRAWDSHEYKMPNFPPALDAYRAKHNYYGPKSWRVYYPPGCGVVPAQVPNGRDGRRARWAGSIMERFGLSQERRDFPPVGIFLASDLYYYTANAALSTRFDFLIPEEDSPFLTQVIGGPTGKRVGAAMRWLQREQPRQSANSLLLEPPRVAKWFEMKRRIPLRILRYNCAMSHGFDFKAGCFVAPRPAMKETSSPVFSRRGAEQCR